MKKQTGFRDVFNFTADDLAANMEGKITERQHQKLKRSYQAILPWLIISGGATLLVLYFILMGAEDFVATCILPLSIAFTTLITFGFIQTYRQTQADIQDQVVNMVCGAVKKQVLINKHSNRNVRPKTYAIEIQQIPFALNSKQFMLFKEGQPYCVYYAASSRTILSARLLEKADEIKRR